jgi:hypothetical protein
LGTTHVSPLPHQFGSEPNFDPITLKSRGIFILDATEAFSTDWPDGTALALAILV